MKMRISTNTPIKDAAGPNERVIAHLDVDCFEVQVCGKQKRLSEEDIQTKPMCVLRHHTIVALNQPAKDAGVTREMKICDANELCPNLQAMTCHQKYGKSEDDLLLKVEGDKIYDCALLALNHAVNGRSTPTVEKDGKEEFFLDLTDEIHHRIMCNPPVNPNVESSSEIHPPWTMTCARNILVEYHDCTQFLPNCVEVGNLKKTDQVHTRQLLLAAQLVSEILDNIKESLGYTVSAGVGSNKLLAKLASAAAKPNGVAVYPFSNVARFSKNVHISKLPGFGGKIGNSIMENFGIHTMKELSELPKDLLEEFLKFKNGSRLMVKITDLCGGHDDSPVSFKPEARDWKCRRSFKQEEIGSKGEVLVHLQNVFDEARDRLFYDVERHKRSPKKLELDICFHNIEMLRRCVSLSLSDFMTFQNVSECQQQILNSLKDLCDETKLTPVFNNLHLIACIRIRPYF